MENRKKLVALVSGGLDSLLSLVIAKNMGFEIIPLHIETPFNSNNAKELTVLKNFLQKEGLDLLNVKVGKDYIEMIKKPKYGYGRALNPCIDCKIFFFKIAKEIMQKEGAIGIVTGEVVNQRPKSQNLKALKIIEKESGLQGRVLRPLSGGIIPPTELVKEGLVNVNELLKIKGKSRKIQLKIAHEFGLSEIPNPSGGCLLTYEPYAKKLKDLFDNDDSYDMTDIDLLKIGRHFRLFKNTKVIIGRNNLENNELLKFSGYIKIVPENCKGPVGIFRGDKNFIQLAVEILASYCDGNLGEKMSFIIYNSENNYKFETLKKDKSIYKKYIVSLN